MVFIRQQLLAPLAFRQESFVVLLSITPLLDGVLRLDIIAPFHTSGPPLLQFHLAIEQWGYQTVHGTNPVTYDLPIPFEEAPFTVAISTGNSGNHASCGGFTKTTIVLRAGTTAGVWDTVGFFIIGCQLQWGNLWAGYTEVLNWYFPLTTSQVYAVCLTKHTKNISSGHNWEPARIEEWNNSYARIHPDGDLGYSVIAICKAQQQWGTNTIGSRTTRTEAYPLPYSEFCLPIVSGKGYVGGLNYGFGVGVTNFGLTSVTIANNSEDSSYRWTGYTYIVVGAQPQWGYCSSRTATFPIPFPASALFIVAVPKTTSTSATATGAEYLGTTSVNLYLHGTSGWYFVGGH